VQATTEWLAAVGLPKTPTCLPLQIDGISGIPRIHMHNLQHFPGIMAPLLEL
jgi:hypothetical protein